MTQWALNFSTILWGAGVLLVAGSANAQLTAELGGSAEAEASTTDGAGADAEMDAERPSEPVAEARADDGGRAEPVANQAPAAIAAGNDHDGVVGHLAVGYLGRRGMQMPSVNTAVGGLAADGLVEEQAPIIGVRYWFDSMVGIDVGFGLLLQSGSMNPEVGPTEDAPGATVFMLHAGVPLSLMSSGHFSFQLVPEANFGMGSRSVSIVGPNVDQSAMHIDVGARVGAEVQFGFINIPQLSLQAGVGLLYAMDSLKVEQGNTTDKRSSGALTTDVGGNPWNIFTSNISALYYF